MKERRFLLIETERCLTLYRIAGERAEDFGPDKPSTTNVLIAIPKPFSPMFLTAYEQTTKEKPL